MIYSIGKHCQKHEIGLITVDFGHLAPLSVQKNFAIVIYFAASLKESDYFNSFLVTMEIKNGLKCLLISTSDRRDGLKSEV